MYMSLFSVPKRILTECENNIKNKTYLDNLIILYKEDCTLDAWMCCVLLIIGKVKNTIYVKET